MLDITPNHDIMVVWDIFDFGSVGKIVSMSVTVDW